MTSVNALANMEYALYGGASGGLNCPSYYNGYSVGMQNGYPYGTGMFGQVPYYNSQYAMNNNGAYPYYSQTAGNNGNANSNQSIYSKDIDTLADFYNKHSEINETFKGAVTGGLTFAAFEAPQTVKHLFNSYKSMNMTDKVFKDLMASNPAVKELWKKSPDLMQSAYAQLHAINRNAQSKWKFIGKWFQKPIEESSRAELEKIMTDAFKTGKEDAIVRATETLKASRGMDGAIPSAWNKVKQFFGANPEKARNFTPMERIANKAEAIEKSIAERGTSMLKKGLKDGKVWFIFDMVLSLPKIFSAFSNGGADSGFTQIAQSSVKAAGTAVGWVAGKALAGVAGAKLGATIGSVFPGVGTAVGAIVGFIGGSVGMWAMNKLTNKLIPVEESKRLETEKMKRTSEGQAQLLSFTISKAQEGMKGNDIRNAVLAAQNVAKQYNLS